MHEESSENFFTELLKFIILAAVIVIPVRLWVAQPFIVSGASMEPTFDTGQYLIIDELSYHLGEPQRGDIIIFRYPRNPSEFFIKRVIGLPNETVEVTPDSVTIVEPDGSAETLSEPYLINRGNGGTLTMKLGPDEYFVMGDNRPNSSDSRSWGAVPRQNIIGHAFIRLLPFSKIDILPGAFSFPAPTLGTTTAAAGLTPASPASPRGQ